MGTWSSWGIFPLAWWLQWSVLGSRIWTIWSTSWTDPGWNQECNQAYFSHGIFSQNWYFSIISNFSKIQIKFRFKIAKKRPGLAKPSCPRTISHPMWTRWTPMPLMVLRTLESTKPCTPYQDLKPIITDWNISNLLRVVSLIIFGPKHGPRLLKIHRNKFGQLTGFRVCW